MHYELLVLVFAALFGIIRFLYRTIRWAMRQSKGTPTGPNPIQQAIADARKQLQPPQALPTRAPALIPARQATRQPQAGAPPVLRETTERDFQRQEQELFAYEPEALGVSLQSPVSAARPPTPNLFRNTDDLVRAFILREALGPPLSRRPRR